MSAVAPRVFSSYIVEQRPSNEPREVPIIFDETTQDEKPSVSMIDVDISSLIKRLEILERGNVISSKLQIDVANQKENFDELRKENAELKENVTRLDKKNVDLEDKLHKESQKSEKLQIEINGIKFDYTKKIKKLKKENEDHAEKIKNLEHSLEDKKTEIQSLTQKLTQSQQQFDELKEAHSKLSREYNFSHLNYQHEHIRTIELGISLKNTLAEKLNAEEKLKTASARILEIENQLQTSNPTINQTSELQSQVNGLNNQVTDLEEKVSELNIQIGDLELEKRQNIQYLKTLYATSLGIHVEEVSSEITSEQLLAKISENQSYRQSHNRLTTMLVENNYLEADPSGYSGEMVEIATQNAINDVKANVEINIRLNRAIETLEKENERKDDIIKALQQFILLQNE